MANRRRERDRSGVGVFRIRAEHVPRVLPVRLGRQVALIADLETIGFEDLRDALALCIVSHSIV